MPKFFQTVDKIKPAYDITYKIVLFICKLLLTADLVITSVALSEDTFRLCRIRHGARKSF